MTRSLNTTMANHLANVSVAPPLTKEGPVTLVAPPTLRIEFSREGHLLHGKGYLIHNGNFEILTATVDLRPLYELAKLNEAKISGIFGSIGNWVKKVGRSKIIKAIGKGAKAVVKSKITGGIVAATAVVFPVVGVPAAAAYAAANVAVDALENGASASTIARGAIAASGSTNPTLANVDKGLAVTQQLQAGAGAGTSAAAAAAAAAGGSKPNIRLPFGPSRRAMPTSVEIMTALKKRQKAKTFLTNIVTSAKTPGPNQLEAKKFIKVVNMVRRNRHNLKAISESVNKRQLLPVRGPVPVKVNVKDPNNALMMVYRKFLTKAKNKTTRKIGCQFC